MDRMCQVRMQTPENIRASWTALDLAEPSLRWEKCVEIEGTLQETRNQNIRHSLGEDRLIVEILSDQPR